MKKINLLIMGLLTFPGGLDSSYVRAFRQLDCVNVFLFNAEENWLHRFLRNKSNNLINRVKGLAGSYLNPALVRAKFINLLKKGAFKEIDLIYDIKSHWLEPDDIKMIKRLTKAKIFHFNPDNVFYEAQANKYSNLMKDISLYDCYFSPMKGIIPGIKTISPNQRIEYLPFACDPYLHYPVELTKKEQDFFKCDIVFIGNWSPEREDYLGALSDFNLAIWGGPETGWSRMKKNVQLKSKWRKISIRGQDYSKACCASKIVLNFLRQGNTHQNMRTFEVPACGSFLLSQRSQEQIEFFVEGKEIVCFLSKGELRKKVEYFLAHDAIRRQIANKGYEKVMSHTYTQRAKRILKVYEAIR